MTTNFCTLLLITTDILQNIGINNREIVSNTDDVTKGRHPTEPVYLYFYANVEDITH